MGVWYPSEMIPRKTSRIINQIKYWEERKAEAEHRLDELRNELLRGVLTPEEKEIIDDHRT